jgi:hypothetical protein
LAWGDVGHRIVARIAALRLTPSASARIAGILGVDNDPAAIGDAIADAAVWPDHVARSKFPETADWHFIDMSLKDGEADQPSPFSNPNTAAAKLVELITALKSGGPDVVDTPGSNLFFVVHFMGDIHQPLHTATDQDRGGNCLSIRFEQSDGQLSRVTKFHHAWDTELVEDSIGTDDAVMALHFSRDFDGLSDRDQAQILLADTTKVAIKDAIHAWVIESHNLAVTPVYANLSPAVPLLPIAVVDSKCSNAADFTHTRRVLDSAYVNTAATLIDQQLLAGGIRLAAVLNFAFGE